MLNFVKKVLPRNSCFRTIYAFSSSIIHIILYEKYTREGKEKLLSRLKLNWMLCTSHLKIKAFQYLWPILKFNSLSCFYLPSAFLYLCQSSKCTTNPYWCAIFFHYYLQRNILADIPFINIQVVGNYLILFHLYADRIFHLPC